MPDFHQPDDAERRDAEATDAPEDMTDEWARAVPLETLRANAVAQGIYAAEHMERDEIIERLRQERPSSRTDPNKPDRPLT